MQYIFSYCKKMAFMRRKFLIQSWNFTGTTYGRLAKLKITLVPALTIALSLSLIISYKKENEEYANLLRAFMVPVSHCHNHFCRNLSTWDRPFFYYKRTNYTIRTLRSDMTVIPHRTTWWGLTTKAYGKCANIHCYTQTRHI